MPPAKTLPTDRPKFYAILTTIQSPTPAMRTLGAELQRQDGRLIVVGDRKGPLKYSVPGSEFFSLAAQQRLPGKLPALLPLDHYARKNLGYLVAIGRGAECIYETDDDNCPSSGWKRRLLQTRARKVTQSGWCNVYGYFTQAAIWPRGFPLEQIQQATSLKAGSRGRLQAVFSPIQQGLVDASPDVDAIWRLTRQQPMTFDRNSSVALRPGVWCPFNSQSTWWWPEAFPLMYLPSFCSPRMTDIWRSFVAQRCVWTLGRSVVFHASEMVQCRNMHDLLKDFREEIPGYLSNDRIRRLLAALRLRPGRSAVGQNLMRCYERLVQAGILPDQELELLRAWLADLRQASESVTSGTTEISAGS